MMKVLHITNAYPTEDYGAFGIFIKEQIESLEGSGIETDTIFINAYEKGTKEYLKVLPGLIGISKNYDIVHCHHAYTGIIYLMTNPFSRTPLVFSNLGDINKQSRRIDRFLFNLIAKRAKAVIYKNSMDLNGYDSKKFHYLPNGVNIDLFRPMKSEEALNELGLSPDKKYVLFVSASGLKAGVKRFDRFKESVNLISGKGVDLEPLILSGVNRDLVPYYFNAASLMILTSDHEGSPNAVKEAMACGLPVISTDVGNVAEMFKGCNSSFVASSNTTEEIAELSIKALKIKNNNGREVLINKGLDINSIASNLINIYKKVISQG